MSDIDELISRLEAAAEGSAELDATVLAHLVVGGTASASPINGCWCVFSGVDQSGRPRLYEGRDKWWQNARRSLVDDRGPTRSLDTAMTLLPYGFAINHMMIWPGCPACLTMVETREDTRGRFVHRGDDRFWKAVAATAPLAVCIAALRAREALK